MQRFTDVPKSNKETNIVEIKAVTWSKDSHGLFDYENSYYDMKKFILDTTTDFYRIQNNVHSILKDVQTIEEVIGEDLIKEANEKPEFLTSIVNNKENGLDKFYVDVSNSENFIYKPYLIIRSLKCNDGRSQRGYILKAGDKIKLGRIDYKILEISTQNGITNASNIINKDINSILPNHIYDGDSDSKKYQMMKVQSSEEILCKYCLMEKISDDPLQNLMLFICTCKEGVHFQCLKNWMQYKIITKSTSYILSYQWKKLDCEICLTPWPRKIFFDNNIYELISIERPNSSYIIIERPSHEPSVFSTISVIMPTEDMQIKFGRGHQCDLRITDISVSRVHTILTMVKNNFILFDNDSKFGTLIELNKNYPVLSTKAAIQVGRTVFTFVQKSNTTKNNITQSTVGENLIS